MHGKDDLIPFEEAIDRVISVVVPLPVCELRVEEAVGLFLAEPVVAVENSPAAPISAMDGYAITETVFRQLVEEGTAVVKVVGEIVAGCPGFDTEPAHNEVVRIFTGAVVPKWAKAVVKQEDTTCSGEQLIIQAHVKEGQYIRDVGSDVLSGTQVCGQGDLITPQAVGLLCSLGIERVRVRPKPRVGIVTTGSELVSQGKIERGQTRDSNGPSLQAMALALGAREVMRRCVRDNPDEIASAIDQICPHVDLLVTTGGVSVGKYDIVKNILISLGFKELFWRVAQRPGMPLFAGVRDGLLVLGLPGNPASALASFLCYAWPVLRRLQGAKTERVRAKAIMKREAKKQKRFTAMLRGRRSFDGATILVETTGPQESHQLLPFVKADCLILGPPDKEILEVGLEVEIVPFPWAI